MPLLGNLLNTHRKNGQSSNFSPNGEFWRGFWLKYRITKDLACLDKLAKYHLSNTQRLRFYKQYRQCDRLDVADKKRIRHVVRFFEGRE